MTKQTFKDFLGKMSRGKYMTVSQFMTSLHPHNYKALVDSVHGGETLDAGARRWAAKHAPDITLIDDDDGEDNSKPFKYVDDDEDDDE
jgi:hypothetical protein